MGILEETEHIHICFSRGFKKDLKCANSFKNNITTMKIKDKGDEILCKKLFKKFFEKHFLMSKNKFKFRLT